MIVIIAVILLNPVTVQADFKAYMDYRCITDQNSVQYQLQQDAHTDENGLRRCQGAYMVAVGSYYAQECGIMLEIITEDGEIIPAIVGDVRADQDTVNGKESRYNHDSIVEFIVDISAMCKTCKKMGDVSHCVPNNVVKISKGE